MNSRRLLPWIVSGAPLGNHLLEIGAGYGAATPFLQSQVPRVTSLEYDRNSILKLKSRLNGSTSAVCGDATRLPFAADSFSSATAILVLHHLKSLQAQDAAFSEAFRVLRPGGVFLAFEVRDNWIYHLAHIGTHYTPVKLDFLRSRLSAAGFRNIAIDTQALSFRFSAIRPHH